MGSAPSAPSTWTRRGLEETIAALRASTDRAFNVNLWVSTHDVPEAEYDGWDEAVARLRPLYDELGVEPPERPPVSAHTFEELVEVVLADPPARLQLRLRHPWAWTCSRPAARPGS